MRVKHQSTQNRELRSERVPAGGRNPQRREEKRRGEARRRRGDDEPAPATHEKPGQKTRPFSTSLRAHKGQRGRENARVNTAFCSEYSAAGDHGYITRGAERNVGDARMARKGGGGGGSNKLQRCETNLYINVRENLRMYANFSLSTHTHTHTHTSLHTHRLHI